MRHTALDHSHGCKRARSQLKEPAAPIPISSKHRQMCKVPARAHCFVCDRTLNDQRQIIIAKTAIRTLIAHYSVCERGGGGCRDRVLEVKCRIAGTLCGHRLPAFAGRHLAPGMLCSAGQRAVHPDSRIVVFCCSTDRKTLVCALW